MLGVRCSCLLFGVCLFFFVFVVGCLLRCVDFLLFDYCSSLSLVVGCWLLVVECSLYLLLLVVWLLLLFVVVGCCNVCSWLFGDVCVCCLVLLLGVFVHVRRCSLLCVVGRCVLLFVVCCCW